MQYEVSSDRVLGIHLPLHSHQPSLRKAYQAQSKSHLTEESGGIPVVGSRGSALRHTIIEISSDSVLLMRVRRVTD